MTERDYILQRFDERFRSFKGRRIALYPGEYLEEIVQRYHPEYRFACILDSDNPNIPTSVDLVVLTDRRRESEPDFERVRSFCEEHGIKLLDLFGLDLLEARRDLESHEHLTIAQWKELLKDYDVVSLSMSNVVADFVEVKAKWVLRRRFLILYDWLKSQGKTVLFIWENEEQLAPLLEEGIEIKGSPYETDKGESIFSRVVERYPEKRIVHVGRNVTRDGIVPREYGITSRWIQYYTFSNQIQTHEKGADDYVDKKQLLEAIDRHDVISFDVFDTLIKRIVLKPKDVFEIVEQRTGVKGFADVRYEVQTSQYHLSLDEIYDWLKANCDYDEKTAETLRQTELQIESSVLFRRDALIEIFEYAKSRNKKIALVSDMYLPVDFLERILKQRGVEGYQTLILSHEYKKLKFEGLFEELINRYPRPETILHIGDNRFSDYDSAKKYGVDAFLVPNCRETAERNGFRAILEACKTLVERKIFGLGVAFGFDNPFAPNDDIQLANMIVAPLLVGYLQWAVDALQGKNYDYFLLTSRDGWILLDAYRRLQSRFSHELPPCKYFYANRRAAFLTVMDNFDLASYFYIFSIFKDDPQKLLRQVFNVPDDKILPYCGEETRKYCQRHETTIHEAAEAARENYRRYLAREGLEGKKCAVMDFVSEGSSQRMLEEHFEKMDGLYVGIPIYVSKYDPNIRYYFDQDLMDYETEMKLEVYFTSPEPALNHIDADGKPIFMAEVRTRKQTDRLKRIHDEIKHSLTVYVDALYDQGELADKNLIFELCKLINRYHVENYYYDDMSGEEISTR